MTYEMRNRDDEAGCYLLIIILERLLFARMNDSK